MAVRVNVNGRKFSHEFRVSIALDVSGFKRYIKRWCGIEEDRQVLRAEGRTWDDKSRLADLMSCNSEGVNETLFEVSLDVIPLNGNPEFSFYVIHKYSFDEYKVTMRETQTVKELKEMIVGGADQMHLYSVTVSYLGHPMEDDDSVLLHYCICSDFRVHATVVKVSPWI